MISLFPTPGNPTIIVACWCISGVVCIMELVVGNELRVWDHNDADDLNLRMDIPLRFLGAFMMAIAVLSIKERHSVFDGGRKNTKFRSCLLAVLEFLG